METKNKYYCMKCEKSFKSKRDNYLKCPKCKSQKEVVRDDHPLSPKFDSEVVKKQSEATQILEEFELRHRYSKSRWKD